MNTEAILESVRASLLAIVEPRFYETERGFQGQLLVELSKRLPEFLSQDGAVVEQEHQKTRHHKLAIRPDIIIHQPFDPALHANRSQGNFAVVELKLRAGPAKAAKDFDSLHSMLVSLNYPIGIFINIGHSHAHAKRIPAEVRGRIVAFATRLTVDGVQVVEERA